MRRKFFRRALKFSLILILLIVLAGAAFTGMVYAGMFGEIPEESELQQIRNATASIIYDRNGKDLGRIFEENRTNADFEDFPENLVNALIATEDARYFEHGGIDVRSVARVLIKTILLGDRSAGGGSTLSQQLAKNLYGRSGGGSFSLAVDKLREMIIATRLEKVYDKNQLIELYLNTVPFSENIYGIETAAQRFFNVGISELRPQQSAVLVGMLKANTYYNPRLHPDHALLRRNVVLGQMERYAYLTKVEADSLKELPLGLEYYDPAREGFAAYFNQQVRFEVDRILEEAGLSERYDPRSAGLHIYTTLDRQLQQKAEKAYSEHLTGLQKTFDQHWSGSSPWQQYPEVFRAELNRSRAWQNAKNQGLTDEEAMARMREVSPTMVYSHAGDTVLNLSTLDSVAYYLRMLRAGFVALEPSTGAVLSWIGGSDLRYLPFDHVLARRQAASTFKPLVFATALEQGFGPCDYWENELREYPEYDNWTPRNYDDVYGGYYSTAGALKKSVNVATVQAMFEVGVDPVLDMARALGIESELPHDPSIALGTGSISLLELARAYAVFANEGVYQSTFFINKITDSDGNILYEHQVEPGEQVISTETARLMTAMLQKVVQEGTAASLGHTYRVTMPLAGKTGTSQDYSDAWFVAYNPSIVAATWVGGAYPVIRFRSGAYGSSSKQALPLVAKFYRSVQTDYDLREYWKIFDQLSPEEIEALTCADFRDKNVLDDILGIFRKEEGKKVDEDGKEKEGFFERLFNRNKKKGK